MEREQVLRLLAEGETGKAIDCLLNSINKDKGNKFSDAYLEVVFLSNRFRRAEKDFLQQRIKYKDFSHSTNAIALSLLDFIKFQRNF